MLDGDLPAHVNKSKLVVEIEPLLDLTQWGPESTYATHVVVDFMSKMRQMPLAQFPTLSAESMPSSAQHHPSAKSWSSSLLY